MEPVEQTLLEIIAGHTDCAAVIGVRNFPKHHGWVVGCDQQRMTHGNVAVLLTVYEQNRNPRC